MGIEIAKQMLVINIFAFIMIVRTKKEEKLVICC